MSEPVPYAAAVLSLYLELPETPLRASLADHRLARRLFDEGVPRSLVEAALLLGSLRRLIRPQQAPPLTPIRSLAYFRPVIDELQAQTIPEGYVDYLRIKLRRLPIAPPANVQKSTFLDDR